MWCSIWWVVARATCALGDQHSAVFCRLWQVLDRLRGSLSLFAPHPFWKEQLVKEGTTQLLPSVSVLTPFAPRPRKRKAGAPLAPSPGRRFLILSCIPGSFFPSLSYLNSLRSNLCLSSLPCVCPPTYLTLTLLLISRSFQDRSP